MSESVKVIVRCRPLNSREKSLNCKVSVDMVEEKGMCFLSKPDSSDQPKQFTFDGAYYTKSTTEQIYNDIAYPLVEGVVEGYNGTVFAYGQTGCGKSFSMQGIEDPPTQRGIIPRAFQHIFESISVAENTKYLVHASYLEIYNEDVRDLLSKNVKEKLEVKEHPDRGVYVKDLSKRGVGNVEECERMMATGWQNRSVGATLMNADSSRSHSIFTIYLEACDTGVDGGDHIRAGKLNLVDLAGSERQAKTGATGDRLKEATKINLSLSALGNVISALVDGKSKHIPYRDSKLTRLLQDSLGGNTKTLMVACLSPADNNYDETLSTLRYANRAKNIKNKPHINEDPKDALLREYQEEIKKLRDLLAGQLGPDGIKAAQLSQDKDQSALLEGQSPIPKKPDNSEQERLDAIKKEQEEAAKMKQEYEEKLLDLKNQFEQEQMSNAKLQKDMDKLKSQYEQQVIQSRPENMRPAKPNAATASPTEKANNKVIAGDLTVNQNGKVAQYIGTSKTDDVTTSPTNEEEDEQVKMQQHQEALKRLQILQQTMVGGENAKDEAIKKRRQSRAKHVDEFKRKLAKAAEKDDEELMLDVYDSMQDQVKSRDKLINKQNQKINGLKMEVEDLSYEFERDRSEYLETIRKQERDLSLAQELLAKIQPTVRRDCNYSNLDKVKSDAYYDEDEEKWVLPDLFVSKTNLPSAGSSNNIKPLMIDRDSTRSLSPSSSSNDSYSQRSDEDRYLAKLNRNSQDNVANNYFMPKRRISKIVSSSSVNDRERDRFYNMPPQPTQQQPTRTSPLDENWNYSSIKPPVTQTFSSAPLYSDTSGLPGLDDMPGRRPLKLEAIAPIGTKTRKKKKKHGAIDPL